MYELLSEFPMIREVAQAALENISRWRDATGELKLVPDAPPRRSASASDFSTRHLDRPRRSGTRTSRICPGRPTSRKPIGDIEPRAKDHLDINAGGRPHHHIGRQATATTAQAGAEPEYGPRCVYLAAGA